MSRIRKEKPKPHIVIPDTSAIWHEDKTFCVNPDFQTFWESYSAQFDMELIIPEMVKNELVFQHSMSALKSLKKANQAISEVQKVTKCQYSHRVTENRVREEVERKFKKWEEQHSVRLLSTPTNVIVWPEVVRKAVWREPPFVFDPQDGDNEKGFRDCMILETLKHFCAQEQRDTPIAFLCKDNLLRETAEKALVGDKRFSVYDLVTDFKTYLDLTRKNLEDTFIKALVKRASDKFFSKGDSECLYFRDNVKKIFQEKYGKYFDNPEESEEKSKLLGLMFPLGMRKWDSTDSGTFWVSRSRFVETDTDTWYVWTNTVTYVRQFTSSEGLETAEGSLGQKQHRVLILPFLLTWRARVTQDGRFWEYQYLKDELKGNQFRPPTVEDRKNWNLEEPKS